MFHLELLCNTLCLSAPTTGRKLDDNIFWVVSEVKGRGSQNEAILKYASAFTQDFPHMFYGDTLMVNMYKSYD